MSRYDDLVVKLELLAVHYRAKEQYHIASQYETAARTIQYTSFIGPDASELYGIGNSVRDDIAEWSINGEIDKLQAFEEKRPHLSNLTAVDGIGVTRADDIHSELGVETCDELRECSDEELQSVDGIGPKTAETIRESLRNL